MRLVPMLTCSLSILALACNCVSSESCSPAETPSSVSVVVSAGNAAPGEIVVDGGTSVRIDPQVRFRYQSVSTTSAGTSTDVEQYEIRGRKLELSEREIRIGDRSYGAFGEAARIEIKPEGVFVDGVLRGELEG